jgi:hypothetical protein
LFHLLNHTVLTIGASENPNVNADEQLETLAEGKVADAVSRKSGTQTAPGEKVTDTSMTSDLDR